MTAEDLEPVMLCDAERAFYAQRARHPVTFETAGAACRVAFDDAEAARAFAARYALLRSEREPLVDVHVARDGVGRLVLVHRGGEAMCWPHDPAPLDVTVFLADAFAITTFFRAVPHLISMHAAVVGLERSAAAIVGDSTAGKTTTAIACARRGMDLYSDERCVISPAGVVPFPRSLNVRSGGARLLLDANADDAVARRLRRSSGADDVAYHELLGVWDAPPARALRSAFLICGIGAAPYVERVARTHVVRAALAYAHCVERGMERFARLLAAFDGVACYRLTLGPPHETAELIEARVRADQRAAPAA